MSKENLMAQKKRERREEISVEHHGREYTGTLIISGTRKLEFTVEYGGRTFSDGRTWGKDSQEQHNLRVMAKTILMELVADAERK
jgi:hypothetical protein